MRKLLLSAMLAGTAFAASPAQAAIFFYFDQPGALQPDEVTQVVNDQNSQTVLAYTNQTNQEVAVHSLDGGNLTANSGGQATFAAADGSLDMGEIYLTDVLNNDFREIEFLFSGSAVKDTTLTFWVGGLNPYTQSIILPKKSEGNYWFSALATGDDYFTKMSYDVTDADFVDIQQLRIGGFDASAVPEPATWGMMIFGLGAVGASMRRRKLSTKISFA